MKLLIFSLLVFSSFLVSPLNAEHKTSTWSQDMADKFIEKNKDQINDLESWQSCYDQCMTDDCSTCGDSRGCTICADLCAAYALKCGV